MPRRRGPVEREPPGPARALELATRFLATRPRSRWEVERRLQRSHADDAVIDTTLQRMTELGLLDDLVFARWWLEQRDRHAPRGRRMVEAELRRQGVGRDVIELLREELTMLEAAGSRPEDAHEPPATEESRARAALAQHLRGRPLPEDRNAVQRLGMFLVRRGFDPDTVRAALRAAEGAGDDAS